VSDLFNSTNGLAVGLTAKLKPFVTYDGMLDTETQNTNAQLKDIGDRIDRANARIDVQVKAYQKQFQDIQALLIRATQAQQIVSGFAQYTSVG